VVGPCRGFPYIVFYIERSDHMDVVRALHGRRDIPTLPGAGGAEGEAVRGRRRDRNVRVIGPARTPPASPSSRGSSAGGSLLPEGAVRG